MGDEDIYTTEFEQYAEKETRDYYRNQSLAWLTKCSLTEYLVLVWGK